jgi:hypothetical protein
MNYAIRISAALFLTMLLGCGNKQKKDEDFFTSGSRSADQRADQRMAKTQQLRGESSGEADERTIAKDAVRPPRWGSGDRGDGR